ncbi:MAG: hypothetical protein P794_02605 [Epsilonproteobacteria bacterium (ex Lamellibrachia satsuma)]|nr:MAG: hypothetical protein P794_02605 [Epsilonproteobacteria bacterium (ex Lamellibrachia satsuma)]
MTIDEKNIGEILYWAYANLAMAHAAYTDKSKKYIPKHFAIRARLFKGLQSGEMNIRSFFDDERLKMILPQECNFCGSTKDLAADHLIPRKKGGLDIGENLVWACKSCNSSKSARDLLEWMNSTNKTPSILIYRRYLKILITYCRENDIMDTKVSDKLNLPFDLSQIPQGTLPIDSLKLWVSDISNEYYRIANWNVERPKKNGLQR